MSLASFSKVRAEENVFVATWATAVQKVEPANLPPEPFLEGNSLRQIVEVSIGGDVIALKLSNEYNVDATEIVGIEIAEALTKGISPAVDEFSSVPLTFKGVRKLSMKPGESVVSDPIPFHLTPRMNVAITIHFGKTSKTDITGHPGSRTTSYIANGNTSDFSNSTTMDHWCYISGLLVEVGADYGAIAVIGNSITDGRGTTVNGQNRWTDVLSERLQSNSMLNHLSVLNLGLGGNCVINGGLGPVANNRFERDILSQEGLKYIIVFEGVNDLGTSDNPMCTADSLIESFKSMISKSHKRGKRIYGATIMPFKGNGYYNVEREKARQHVNEWIRQYGVYDGVIDFDSVMSDAADRSRLNPLYLYESDWLHPNAQGYRVMGESIDLSLFAN